MFVHICIIYVHDSPDASIVHASGIGQLRENPPVVDPRFSPGKPTGRAVTMMGFNN